MGREFPEFTSVFFVQPWDGGLDNDLFVAIGYGVKLSPFEPVSGNMVWPTNMAYV
jgi:hypothetical protein